MERRPKRLEWITEMNKRPFTLPKISIGKSCDIHSTVLLGEQGVGMERDEKGAWVRCRQHGDVIIGENVRIGPYSNVKRGTMPGHATVIGSGSEICTYVNIGHNCKIGQNVFIGPHVCLNGSVEVGDNCWIAGHVSIRQHTKIGDNVMIGLGAVVVRDVPSGETVVGNPAVPIKFLDNCVHDSFVYGKNLKIGKFNHIHEGVKVGDDVTIRSYVELRKDTVIGDRCYIDSGVKSSGQNRIGNDVILRFDSIIARNVIIEDDVFISPQVVFINIPFTEKEKKKTIIRRGVKIGTSATINDGVEIGEGVIIGAKAFVNRDCLEPGTYVGIPARRMKR